MTVHSPLSLEKFFDALRRDNPFALNRIEGHCPADLDVEGIHAEAFEKLVALAGQVRAENQGLGAALLGEPGTGKSHLLARLGRWAGHGDQACFVYCNHLHAHAEHLPRFILYSVLRSLTGGRTGDFHDTKLYRLMRVAVEDAKRQENLAGRSQRQILAVYYKFLDRLATDSDQAPLFDRAIFTVLLGFYLSANVAHHHPGKGEKVAGLAVRWLSGEDIDPDEAVRLGLPRGANAVDPAALRNDVEILKVLFALAQLARHSQQPFVLCFDHVDQLDRDRLDSLFDFLPVLLNNCGNLLVICAGVPDLLSWFRKHGYIPEPAWRRVSQNEIRLGTVRRLAARRILEARLKQFLASFAEQPEIQEQRTADPLFPLGRSWFDLWLRQLMEVRPREILTWAGRRWRSQQQALSDTSGPAWLEQWFEAIPEPPKPLRKAPEAGLLATAIDHRVDQAIAEHKLRPLDLPVSADDLAGLVHRLLQQCLFAKQQYGLSAVEQGLPAAEGIRPVHDVLVRHDGGEENKQTCTGLLCLTTSNSFSSATRLRRLAEDEATDRVILVTEERRPLPPDSEGKKYLKELRQRGAAHFRHVELTLEEHVHLDVLQAVVSMARCGDLQAELPDGTIWPVSEREVIQSHHRQDRYAAHPLLRRLLGTGVEEEIRDEPARNENPAPDGKPALDEQDLRQFILAHVGSPGVSSHELCAKYVRHLQVTKRVRVDLTACKPHLEEVARKMHHDGFVNATPSDDGLYLLPKKE